MATVTIVIPIFNGAGFLPGAVKSVLCQTSPDWKLIIVDDGSTDGVTPALCDSYAQLDPRITALHKPNGGQADARNHALPYVDTDYLTFLDADDLLHPRYVELTLNAATESDADIVFGGVDFYKGEFRLCNVPDDFRYTLHEPVEVAEKILYQTGFDNAVGGKIFKTSLWKDFRFPAGRYYEDLHISYRLVLKSKRIALIDLPLYGYLQHSGSFVHTWSDKRLDVLDVTDEMVDWIERNRPALLPAAADRRMSAHFNILLLLYKNRIDNPAVEARCLDIIRTQRSASLRDSKVRLKNRIGALASIVGGRWLLRLLARLS